MAGIIIKKLTRRSIFGLLAFPFAGGATIVYARQEHPLPMTQQAPKDLRAWDLVNDSDNIFELEQLIGVSEANKDLRLRRITRMMHDEMSKSDQDPDRIFILHSIYRNHLYSQNNHG